MSSTERFLKLCDELEKAIEGDHWELAEDLFAERGRLIESGALSGMTPEFRQQVTASDARCQTLIRQKQRTLVGAVQRMHDIEKYGRQDR